MANGPRSVRTPRGWQTIIVDLLEAIAALSDQYRVTSVTGGGGTLRVEVAGAAPQAAGIRLQSLISKAEAACGRTCERCAVPGELIPEWDCVACAECLAEARDW